METTKSTKRESDQTGVSQWRQLSPSTNWASLLQKELSNRDTRWGPNDLSTEDIAEMRKKSGLPGGRSTALRWVSKLKKAGKAKQIEGYRYVDGKRIREVRYRLK